jgi:magnesium transporter
MTDVAENNVASSPPEGALAFDLTASVRALSQALLNDDMSTARDLVEGLSSPDLADLLELLDAEDRVKLIEGLGHAIDYEVFSELDETVRDQLSEDLSNEFLAKAVTELDSDDGAYLLENLEIGDQQEILDQLPSSDRAALQRNLEYPEETAGRLMQSDFVAVAPFWTVGHVIDYMRDTEDLPDTFSEILVVDPKHQVLGSVELSRILRTKRQVRVDEIMNPERHLVSATSDQEEVARQFQRYDLMSAPVVDETQRLVGVITIDDVVDVIQEEAEEDMKALAGIGDETLADTVLETVKSRVPWLVVNLFTAVLASFVIQLFDATIEQMVALAVLMPIVASMGGNAGTQTMTVTVRALATNKIGRVNAPRIVTREALVGVANGLIFAVIMGAVTYIWFGSNTLGAIIGIAMVINMIAAAIAGILIPLAMDWLDLDPAPASGVFVTTVTDVIGFFAFLGLAALWLM